MLFAKIQCFYLLRKYYKIATLNPSNARTPPVVAFSVLFKKVPPTDLKVFGTKLLFEKTSIVQWNIKRAQHQSKFQIKFSTSENGLPGYYEYVPSWISKS